MSRGATKRGASAAPAPAARKGKTGASAGGNASVAAAGPPPRITLEMITARLVGLLGIAALAGLIVVSEYLVSKGWRFTGFAGVTWETRRRCYALLLGAGALAVLGPRRWRRAILLIPSAVGLPAVLGDWALLAFAYPLWVSGITRSGLKVRYQLFLVVGAWVAFLVYRNHGLREFVPQLVFFTLLWAQYAYAGVYLVLERARGQAKLGLIDELFYFVGLPRLIEPFFQPISPSYMIAQDRGGADLKLLVRGVFLVGWAAAWAVFPTLVAYRIVQWNSHLYWPVFFGIFYSRIATHIFFAMAIYRFLGFDLSSGFKTPWLSTSFSEFFRRFNHYVRDAVFSLFYLPIVGWLRLRMPKRAASVLAAYLAIFIGSFLFNDALIIFATSIDFGTATGLAFPPMRMLLLFGFWTAIILPATGLVPRRSTEASTWPRRIYLIVIFNIAYFAVWWAMSGGLVSLHESQFPGAHL